MEQYFSDTLSLCITAGWMHGGHSIIDANEWMCVNSDGCFSF